jgi:hypothetical protein
MNAKKEGTPLTAGMPTSEGIPMSVVTLGAEGMLATKGTPKIAETPGRRRMSTAESQQQQTQATAETAA